MKKIILILFVFLFGCAIIPTSNIPEYKEVEQPKIEKNERRNISFSVNVYGGGNNLFVKKDLIDDIRTKLKESGLFKKVTYSSEPYEDLHYNFEFKKTIYSGDEFATSMAAGYSLCLIPLWVRHYVDSTMFITKGGKEVYSTSVPSKITVVIWAPLLMLSPIFNNATAENNIIKKHLNYYVNEIIDNKLY